ncbi:MAG: preprotein translocase subunit SecA [Zetaproteobacteria bacterium]|nr:preprotein translocase subunit SecA [Pseudobdellovibrionaceae bacterium]
MNFLTKIFGTRNDKLIKELKPTLLRINELEASYQKLDDQQLSNNTDNFRQRLDNGESLQSLLPEAFATCREASRRVIGQRHYDVQLMGGMVLQQGKIAEMKTGEGKTLTATLPCYLHGLSGKGAHVVTVNDYLAKRDAEWMSSIYKFLKLSTGIIAHSLSDEERKKSYACDITYGTNNEFGFDYLRDNMKTNANRLVQRKLNFAIVDEVDSILIDEARTPLIISGPADTNLELYKKVNAVIPGIQKDVDYTVDEKSRSVSLTEDGISKMEKRLSIDNLYDSKHADVLHHVQSAFKAHIIFKKDVDYVVRDGQILIVDEFTGRLMPGRRYSDGLHGALEAKEHVNVQQESQTLASITFQNFFRMYDTLSGMTGTADTEAVEFNKIYGLEVLVLPTNKKIIRKDHEDVIYRTAREKFVAVADDIASAQRNGQPVLVGTVSVERSELLSSLLKQRNIPHEILNAKNHAREAAIIASAGEKGHVTIATNMAGRGTDIVLGEGVRELGGLYVVATERHESRRIDNQLRGRSGRQGDPGMTKFFLSLEDDLMRIFASDKLSGIMSRLGMEEGESIVSPMVTRAIEKAQMRVEEQNFSSRKNLLEYDDVMSQQRQVVYQRRHKALVGEAETDFISEATEGLVHDIASRFSPESLDKENWDIEAIKKEIKKEFNLQSFQGDLNEEEVKVEELVAKISDKILKSYDEKLTPIGEENKKKVESFIYLQIIDHTWKDHLLAMDYLKDSVSLRSWGNKNPLQEYKREAFTLFEQMIHKIETETSLMLLRMPAPEAQREEEEIAQAKDDEVFSQAKMSHPEANSLGAKKQNLENTRARGGQEQTSPIPYKRETEKVGRNSPCPCGSGKKFKKCHGISDSGL